MNLDRFLDSVPRHRETALDVVRIFLGVGLTVRGIIFVADPGAFYGFLDAADPAFAPAVLAHYVTLAHLVGGFLLALGFLTRLAAAVQVPVLAGALFFVHLGEPLAVAGQGIELSALVLLLLLVFTVIGAGRLSLDHQLFVVRSMERSDEAEHRLIEQRTAELHARESEHPELAVASRDSMEENPCIHGRPREHPRVTVERDYGFGRSLRFVVGTTVTPRRVVFRCADCGGVVGVSTDPDDLQYYRYHEEKGPATVPPGPVEEEAPREGSAQS
jgi:uncharacterized membrane protein YphA (DoxX/SURF4 family)